MTILSILEEIASDNSRKHKEAVFAKNADNELFKRACYLAYDPKIQFYQRKIPAYSSYGNQPLEVSLNDIMDLSTRKVTGNDAIAHLKAVLERSNADDAKVIEKIVLKDFSVGASEGTIGRTWPKLLSEYAIALSSAFKLPLLEKLIAKPGKKYAQLKSDGARTPIHISPVGVVQIFTRQGREVNVGGRFDWLGEIEAFRGKIIDGEMLARDPATGKPMPRRTGNGLVNKAVKGTLPEAEMDILYLTAWDIISIEEFEAGKGTVKYEDRFAELDRLLQLALAMNAKSNVELIESREITTVEEAVEAGQAYIDMGLEGAMIKHGDMLWEDGRSKLSLKIKGEYDCDLRIVDVQEGKDKYAGLFGAYVCESEDRQLRVNVNVRGDDGRLPMDRKDEVIDKILGVLSNGKIKAKNRKAGEPEYSLFLPRVHPEKGIRTDKTVADTIDNIE